MVPAQHRKRKSGAGLGRCHVACGGWDFREVLSSCCGAGEAAPPLTLILSFCYSNECLLTSLGAGQCAVLQNPVNRTHRVLSFLTKLLRQTRKDYPRGACGGFEARGPSWSRGIFGGSLDFGYLG